MKKYITSALLIVVLLTPSTMLNADNLNVECIILDSLTNASIPAVKVYIKNLNKSFTTARSAFYLMLTAGHYDFQLEADEYEPLNSTINISPGNQKFTFYLVKVTDRVQLNMHLEVYRVYFDSLIRALKQRDPFMARQLITDIQNYPEYKFTISDTIFDYFNSMAEFWSESLLAVAQVREDSQQLTDAYYYYKKIIDFDSTIIKALEGLKRVDEKLLKPATPSVTTQTVNKSPKEIEQLFQNGVTKFLAEEYNEALKIFKTVLNYDPNHENAMKYLARTKARLKALGK